MRIIKQLHVFRNRFIVIKAHIAPVHERITFCFEDGVNPCQLILSNR